MTTSNNRVFIADNLDSFSNVSAAKGEVSVLDCDQIYRHITPLQDSVLGFGGGSRSLVGKTNFDIEAPAVELAPQFHQECQKVIDSQTSMVFFCAGKFSDNELINYVYAISPVQSPSGQPLGLIVQGERLDFHADVMQAISVLHSKMDKHGNYKTFLFAPAYPGLSKKESSCLYWMLRGYSATQTAEILALSPRTVESYLVSVKHKYQCLTKQELHDYCFDKGLIQILPTIS